MFSHCTDPKTLEGLSWLVCYLTNGKHIAFYWSFLVVIALLLLAAPLSLAMGFLGAFAKRSRIAPFRWLGIIYTSTIRGVPSLVFFLFVPIALDQAVEFIRHRIKCADNTEPVWQGNDFIVCAQAKMPIGVSAEWVHDLWGFTLALIAFAIVFGAFAALIIEGALKAVPRGQVEAAKSVGMTPSKIMRRIQLPQMWIYALPGMSNLWQVLIKSSPLLFLMGIEDVVYWARELGGSKTAIYDYPHPDWRLWYFAGILVFYMGLTWISQIGFERLMKRVSRGQAVAMNT